jgi:hypothetical protein
MSVLRLSKQLEASGSNQIQVIMSRDDSDTANLEGSSNTIRETVDLPDSQRVTTFARTLTEHIDHCQRIWTGDVSQDLLSIFSQHLSGKISCLMDFEACLSAPVSLEDD